MRIVKEFFTGWMPNVCPTGAGLRKASSLLLGCENRFSAVPVEREVRFRRTVELEIRERCQVLGLIESATMTL